MGVFKKLLNSLRSNKCPEVKTEKKFETEEDYYRWFFTENPSWNTPEPNFDEQLRWNCIKDFLTEMSVDSARMNILDLGCSRGWLTKLLSDYGKVIGIEPVKPVVNYANKLFPNLDITCGTAETLIDANYSGTFDLIVSSEVIEHVPDKEKMSFVQSIYRLLKPSGAVIITTPRKDVEREWLSYKDVTQPIEDWLTDEQTREIFLKNNFSVESYRTLSKSPVEGAPEMPIYQVWKFRKE